MNRQELYQEIISLVPVSRDDGKSYRDILRSKLKDYKQKVEELDAAERQDDWENIVQTIDRLSNALNDCALNIYKGLHSTAFTKLSNQLKDMPIAIQTIGEHTKFYRMRTFPVRKRNIKLGELFHIPYDKRGIVKTQRYSMPGYPCLYLGYSIYGCWEEMERPNTDTCMFSRLENREQLKVIDLRVPDEENWNANMSRLLRVFPLIIACMIVVDDSSNVFKAEYIIPQLLMEWVIMERNRPARDMVHGISYTSAYENKDFHFPQYTFDNIAIPVINPIKGKYCKKLKEIFQLTEPTCFEYEDLRGLDVVQGEYGENVDEELNNYNTSKFGILERRLEAFDLRDLQE